MTNHKKLSNDAPIEASARAQQGPPKLRILQAARELFFSKGVAAVTTDMLVKRAKTSKMTLYKYFANKDEILEQVVSEDVSRIFEPLNTNIESLDDYTHVVISFCQNLVDIIFDPEIVRFDQLMISQALSHQELTQIHYNRTYQPTIERVQQLLELGQRKGYTRAIHGFDDSQAYSAKEIRDIVEVLLGLRSRDDA